MKKKSFNIKNISITFESFEICLFTNSIIPRIPKNLKKPKALQLQTSKNHKIPKKNTKYLIPNPQYCPISNHIVQIPQNHYNLQRLRSTLKNSQQQPT